MKVTVTIVVRWLRQHWFASTLVVASLIVAALLFYPEPPLTRARALAIAMDIFEDACLKQCAENNVSRSDFQGPFEAPINNDEATRSFEFYWKATSRSKLFLISVYDNGLFTDWRFMWIYDDGRWRYDDGVKK